MRGGKYEQEAVVGRTRSPPPQYEQNHHRLDQHTAHCSCNCNVIIIKILQECKTALTSQPLGPWVRVVCFSFVVVVCNYICQGQKVVSVINVTYRAKRAVKTQAVVENLTHS